MTDRVLERLAALTEISHVFAARLHCLDAKDWDRYPNLHTEDVESRTWGDLPDGAAPGGASVVVGNHALTKAVSTALGPEVITVHQGYNPEIELLSATRARGVWSMEDRLWWRTTDGAIERFHGWGYYHETYRRIGGHWLISSRALTRIRTEATPGFFKGMEHE